MARRRSRRNANERLQRKLARAASRVVRGRGSSRSRVSRAGRRFSPTVQPIAQPMSLVPMPGGGMPVPTLPGAPLAIMAIVRQIIALFGRRAAGSGILVEAKALWLRLPQWARVLVPPGVAAWIGQTVAEILPPGETGGGLPALIPGPIFPLPVEPQQATNVIQMEGGVITKSWQPNPGRPPTFYRIDYPGSRRRTRILVQRKDGTFRSYVPQRHLVITRDPKVRDLARAAKKLDKLTAAIVKIPKQTKRAKDRVK